MAMDKCIACGQMRDDSSGTCPGCIALGMKSVAAQQAPSDSSWKPAPAPPRYDLYLPKTSVAANDLLKAICLAWEAAEFGASMNRAAKEAGATLGGAASVHVTAFRKFACSNIRNNADTMLDRDREMGYGPSSDGLEWEGAYCGHSSVTPRAARKLDGERLIELACSIRRLTDVCDLSGHEDTRTVSYAATLAFEVAEKWPRLIPWAFDMCEGGEHRRAVCKCQRCRRCGERGEVECRRCFCECGTERMWRLHGNSEARSLRQCDFSGHPILLCPKCDCFECAGRGRITGMSDGWPAMCAECVDDRATAALECPRCGETGALSRYGDALSCGLCCQTSATRAA